MGALAEKFRFDLDGGRVSLDFVNTVSGLRGARPIERLTEYGDLVWWAQQVGLLSKKRAAELYAGAQAHPRRAEAALAEAIRAREALHDVAVAAVEGREPDPAALAIVDRWITAALQHRRLKARPGGRFALEFEDDGDLLFFLRPVAADAASVLAEAMETGRVRRCDESSFGNCGWLFLDETRNHSRRYCSMSDCGNTAKQRRFRERHR
ncbi:MAG: CGNR zinc finger domain-containing protein [Myxococcales bacterium]